MLTPCFAFITPESNPASLPWDRRKPLTGCSGGTETKRTDGLPVVPLSEPEYENFDSLILPETRRNATGKENF